MISHWCDTETRGTKVDIRVIALIAISIKARELIRLPCLCASFRPLCMRNIFRPGEKLPSGHRLEGVSERVQNRNFELL